MRGGIRAGSVRGGGASAALVPASRLPSLLRRFAGGGGFTDLAQMLAEAYAVVDDKTDACDDVGADNVDVGGMVDVSAMAEDFERELAM
eukprot:4716773-Pleurochrysis_carterae.AAC.1